MTNIRRIMVGVAAAAAVLAGCDPYSKAATADPSVVAVTATSGADSTTGTQASPGVWTIDGAGTACAGGAVSAAQPIVFVTFNKQMNPATVQSSVTDCTPTNGWLKVTAPDGTTPIAIPSGTAWYSCYTPSSPTAAEGGSAVIFLGNAQADLTGAGTDACSEAVPPESGWASAQAIDAAAVGITSVRFTGSVSDKDGRATPVDVTVNYTPNPGTARNLTASATTNNSVTLSWTDRPCAATSEATSIKDEIRATDADGNTTTVATVDYVAAANTPHSVTVPGDPAAPVDYALVAVTTVGSETFEQEQASLTGVVPGIPTPVAAPTAALSAGKLPIIVTTPDPATITGIDDLDVYRASYASETSTTVGAFSRLGNVGAGKTTFIDVSSAANSKYVYKLVPVKSVADTRARGADSPVSAAFVTAPTDPGAGTPTATNNSVDLQWDFLPGTISSGTLTLALERGPAEAGPFATVGTVTPDADNEVINASDTTVAADTTYWYRLSAANSAGEVKSTPVSVTTLAFAAPTGVAGTRSGSQVTVNWTASPSAGVTGYVVSRSLQNACGFEPVGQPVTSGTTFTDPAAPAGSAYEVTATGAGGKESPPSAPSTPI